MAVFQNFTSLPPHEEQTFVVYEQRMADASKTGYTLAAILSAIILVFAFYVYLGIDPVHIDYAKDMNMSNLSKKEEAAPAPAPAAPAAAPDTGATGTAPAPEAAAPEAPAPEAPAPD